MAGWGPKTSAQVQMAQNEVSKWSCGAAPQARYLDVLARDTRRAIRDGLPLSAAVDTIAGSEADAWALFDVFNPRNATVAFTELEWE